MTNQTSLSIGTATINTAQIYTATIRNVIAQAFNGAWGGHFVAIRECKAWCEENCQERFDFIRDSDSGLSYFYKRRFWMRVEFLSPDAPYYEPLKGSSFYFKDENDALMFKLACAEYLS